MRLHHYTVSQVRLAATCPRVHYFDGERARRQGNAKRSMTRLWKNGGVPAGGAAFHRAVEKLARQAAHAPEIVDGLRSAKSADEVHQVFGRYVHRHCIDARSLAEKPVAFQQGFTTALTSYLSELSKLAFHRMSQTQVGATELVAELFGDQRKRIDVSLRLGDAPGDGDVVRITGAIDHVYFDGRLGGHRILEYKLTPPSPLHGDLIQVSTYALLHDHQHATRPTVAVYYLHPRRALVEKTWEDVRADRGKVYDYIASLAAWDRFDEKTGRGVRPPGDPTVCETCPWSGVCEQRLGPKSEGAFVRTWEDLAERGGESEPRIDVSELASDVGEQAYDDEVEAEGLRVGSEPPAPVDGDRGLLRIGATTDGRSVSAPPGIFNTHVAVVGAAGSGKTWTAKVIAEEAVRNGVPVIAVDPQGDLVQFVRQRDENEIDESLRPLYRAFVERVEPRVYTPGTSHATRLSLDPIRLPRPGELEERIPGSARREEERRAILENVARNLVNLADIRGDTVSQVAFLYQLLLRLRTDDDPGLRDVVRAIQDPAALDEQLDADALIKSSERAKLALRLNSYVLGPAAALFEGGVPLDLDAMLTPTREGRTPLNVIYLNALVGDAQRHFFVASLAAEIYRWMVTSTGGSRTPQLLFYLDEARDYVPAGTKEPPAKQPLIRLFTQGRKYGVGCLICTQSPRSVDYNVFGNCSTKLVGRLASSQDVDRVREWFTTGAPPAWLGGRKNAAKGSFVGRWVEGGVPEGTEFRSRVLFSRHEGAWSPDRVEAELA